MVKKLEQLRQGNIDASDAPTSDVLSQFDTVGECLKSLREAAGRSIDETSDLTKIKPVYIRAIESADYANLPPASYAVGFVKIYAGSLGQNAAEFAKLFRKEMTGPDAALNQPSVTVHPSRSTIPTDPKAASSITNNQPTSQREPAPSGLAITAIISIIVFAIWIAMSLLRADSSQTTTSEAPILETIAPETIVPETIVPEIIASETIIPEITAPQTIVEITAETVAPSSELPETAVTTPVQENPAQAPIDLTQPATKSAVEVQTSSDIALHSSETVTPSAPVVEPASEAEGTIVMGATSTLPQAEANQVSADPLKQTDSNLTAQSTSDTSSSTNPIASLNTDTPITQNNQTKATSKDTAAITTNAPLQESNKKTQPEPPKDIQTETIENSNSVSVIRGPRSDFEKSYIASAVAPKKKPTPTKKPSISPSTVIPLPPKRSEGTSIGRDSSENSPPIDKSANAPSISNQENSQKSDDATNPKQTLIKKPAAKLPPETIITKANLVNRPPLEYPQRCSARARGPDIVKIGFDLTATGEVINQKILSSSRKCFESAALRNIKKWRYNPKLENGRPVRSNNITITIKFLAP